MFRFESFFGERARITTLAVFLSLLAVESARADLFVTAKETSDGTTISWNGFLDVLGWTPQGRISLPESSIFPKMGVIAGAGLGKTELDVYHFAELSLRPIGAGGGKIAASVKGDALVVTNTLPGGELCLCLPAGYRGEKLRGEVTFPKATLESLGLDQSPFAYDLKGQFIHFFAADSGAGTETRVFSPRMTRETKERKPQLGRILKIFLTSSPDRPELKTETRSHRFAQR